MPKKTRKKRKPPYSYRPPEALRDEFLSSVEKSDLSICAFLTKAWYGKAPQRQVRRPSKDKIPFGKLLAHEAENVAILRAVLELDNLPEDIAQSIEKVLSRSPEIRKDILEAMGKKP